MSYRQVPNLLTTLRALLALVAYALFSYVYDSTWGRLAVLAVYSAAIITDYYDGDIARRWNAESAFGKIADPFSDKTLSWVGFIMLWRLCPGTWDDELHGALLVLFGIVGTYDIGTLALRFAVMLGAPLVMNTRSVAKHRTAALHISLATFLAAQVSGDLGVGSYVYIISAFVIVFSAWTIASACDYVYICATCRPATVSK